MDSGHDGFRMNVEGDRLSNLPDDLIHKILSLLDIKHAIETSALSSRWRYIWASMPCLNLSSKDFHTFTKFSNFVTCVLSGRNNQIEVSSLNLTFHGKVSQAFAKVILDIIFNYEICHNVQQLNITCSPVKKIQSPLSLFSSQSLKHITLIGCTYAHPITTKPTWELPTLKTLILHCVTFIVDYTIDKCGGLFSNFANLMNLTLKGCRVMEFNRFNICHPTLASLTLEDGCEGVNVVTPQLNNLTIRNWRNLLIISAPDLLSLHYKGFLYPLKLSADLHLEKVYICLSCSSSDEKAFAHKIVSMLQQLPSVRFLTLNLEIIKVLSSCVELISHQPSPFANLKSLNIYPHSVSREEQRQPIVTMSTEVKNYLLDGSPGATLIMVSHEEIRAVMDATLARNLMRNMQVLLDKCKENSETNTTHSNYHFGETMRHMNEQFKQGYSKTSSMISVWRAIEEVMAKLPTSHRAKLQGRFSSLCAEAETTVDNMVDHLKFQCDKTLRF